jgi:helix-turn-helix protein
VDDSSCLRYFLEPDDTLHRRYEALRAYFVQRRPLPEIAIQFGYTYDTLRQVIHQFRIRCRSGTPPPFSPPRAPDVGPKPPRPGPRCPKPPRPGPRCPMWPTDDA